MRFISYREMPCFHAEYGRRAVCRHADLYLLALQRRGNGFRCEQKNQKNSPLLIWLTNFRSIRYIPSNPLTSIRAGRLKKVRGFVLHSTDYIKPDTVVIDDKIAVSSSIDIITDIAFGTGPKKPDCAGIRQLGAAAAGKRNRQQQLAGSQSDAGAGFQNQGREKWQKAIGSLGIDLSRLVAKAGHA